MSSGSARLFLGVPVPAPAREALRSSLRAGLGDGPLPGRPVPPANWHLTLRFLGQVEAEARDRLLRELSRADLGSAFALELGGLGAFPRPARAGVLWAGVRDGAEPLRELAARVEEVVESAGFARETRAFSPHLTLARVHPPRDVRETIARGEAVTARFAVEEAILYRSHLGGGPPRYEAEARFPLVP